MATSGVAPEQRVPFDDDDLQRFLTQLRQQGWKVGAEQFVAVQLLLARLAEVDALPENPRELGRYIGPVLCGTRRQQAEFRRLFDVWIGPLVQPVASPVRARPARPAARGPTLEEELRALQRRRSVSRVLLAAVVVVAVVVAALRWVPVGGGAARPGTPAAAARLPSQAAEVGPGTEVWGDGPAAAALVAVVVAAAAGLWWRRRFLARAYASTPPNVERLSVGGPARRDWLPPVRRDVAVRMRQREVFDDVELDVERTVEACAGAAGRFSPVYTTRSRIPEYLVLIDRAAPDDLRAVRARAIVDALADEGVYAVVYCYEGDPRFAYRDREARRVPLAELHQRHPHHRLVVCGETEGFVSALTGRLHPWVSALARWEHRSLLTLVPVVDWGAHERALMSAGFRVMPASPDGFAAVADTRLAQQVIADARSAQVPRYPHRLSADEMLWLDPNVPARDQLCGGLDEVRRYLGETGYAWLAACAVYPEVRPALTLYLGDRVAAPYQAAVLERLARLPWMRQAFMPDWLRRALLGDLRGEQERSTRGLLRTLLLSPPSGGGAGTPLDVARRNYAELARLWRARMRHWKRDVPAGEPLRDHVFLSWMDDRLAVRVPKALLRWLRARGRSAPRYNSGSLSPDTAHYYRVEYGLALRRLPADVAGLAGAGFVGVVYGGISHSLTGFFGAPINLAVLFLTLIGVMVVAAAVVEGGKLRGARLGGAAGLLCGLAFTYCNWWGWITLERAGGERVYDPTLLVAFLTELPHGSDNYVLWLAESGIVLLGASWFAAQTAARPFCTTCQTWTTKRERVYGPLADQAAALREILYARYTKLFALSTASPHHANATAATLERCELSCGATTLLTLRARHSVRDARGHIFKETDKSLIERLFVPDHVSRAVAEWVDATASVRPNLAPAGREVLRRAIDVVLTLRAVPSKKWYIYGNIPVDAAKKVREAARIPLREDIIALAVHSRWTVVAPRYSAYAFTERGVYAYTRTAQFTAYDQVSARDLESPVRLDHLLRDRQVDFDLPVAVEAFARIAAAREGA